MKIAVISDIHGNLPALEAVINDINNRGINRIICLGDLIGKGPNSKEVTKICKERCDIVLKGNWEDNIYQAYLAEKQKPGSVTEHRVILRLQRIGDEYMEYYSSLPHSAELVLSNRMIRLFHAHPQNFSRYHADSPLEKRLELFERSLDSKVDRETDIAIYGDIHSAYMQTLAKKYILLNAGSVGNPLDITQASYVILEGDDNQNAEAASLSIQFVRVLYDIDRAVKLAQDYDVPDLDGYISELRTAQYFRRS